jgi:hypothetical protein
MRIDELPRPWLLAAMTGVPMATLLECAERERAERAEEAQRSAIPVEYRRSRAVRRQPGKPVGPTRLAS